MYKNSESSDHFDETRRDEKIGLRILDASCTAFRELFQRLVEVPIKLLCSKFEYNNARVSKYLDACWFKSYTLSFASLFIL